MAFDLSTAKPVTGFDPSTAKPVQQPQPSYIDNALSVLNRVGKGVASAGPLETALHLGSGAVAGLGGGLNYLGTLMATRGDTDAAKAVQEDTQRALTYQPRTQAGKAIADAADRALGYIPQKLDQAGAATAEATGSPLLGTIVNTGGNAALQALGIKGMRGAGRVATAADDVAVNAPKAAPTTPAELAQQSFDNGKAVGYQTTPNYDPSATGLDRLGQSIAGKANAEQRATVQNQPVTNALAARAVGLTPDQLVTHNALQQIRQAAVEKGYAPIEQLDGPIQADAQFMKNNAQIKSAHGDPLSGNPDVQATANILMGLKNKAPKGSPGLDPLTLEQQAPTLPTFDPANITDQIGTLRSRASDAFANGRKSAATAFRSQAEELEALLDRHLQDQDNLDPSVLTNYRAARQLIAKTHAVGENLNPSTGNIDAAGLGTQLKNGAPLTGDLKTIADFANAAPSIARVPNGTPLPTSPLTLTAGALASHATHGASLALIPAARAFAAKWLLQRNDNPALLQPLGKTFGASALDAIHGNAKAFANQYGSAAVPGALGMSQDQQ